MPLDGDAKTTDKVPGLTGMPAAEREIADLRATLATEGDKVRGLMARVDSLVEEKAQLEIELEAKEKARLARDAECATREADLVKSQQLLAAQVDACRKAAGRIVPVGPLLRRLAEKTHGKNPVQMRAGKMFAVELPEPEVPKLLEAAAGIDDLPAAVGWQ